MNPQATLFDQGLSRASDPETSRQAASVISTGVEHAVYECFSLHGPMHDDLLVQRLDGIYGPTAKSARSRLVKRGLLVATDERGLSGRGRLQVVWALRRVS